MSEFMLHLYRGDHHLKRIGACKDGSLFWIDSQFVTEDGAPVDYLCTYRFAADGQNRSRSGMTAISSARPSAPKRSRLTTRLWSTCCRGIR